MHPLARAGEIHDGVVRISPAPQLARASELRRYHADGVAAAFEKAADELERELREVAHELLNLVQAAEYSGYSADHLGRMVQKNQLRNYGRKNAPLVRRDEIPSKPGSRPRLDQSAQFEQIDRVQIARSIVNQSN